jgi:hypothetical protein
MRRTGIATLVSLLVFTLGNPVHAQKKPPKIESLQVRLAQSKADAMELVVAAFMNAGLDITDNSGSLVEAEMGQKKGGFLGNTQYTRTVRALVVGAGTSSSVVTLRGEEVQDITDSDGRHTIRRYHIDSKAKKDGGKVWKKMIDVAMALDSTQAPFTAVPHRNNAPTARTNQVQPSQGTVSAGPATSQRSQADIARQADSVRAAYIDSVTRADSSKAISH